MFVLADRRIVVPFSREDQTVKRIVVFLVLGFLFSGCGDNRTEMRTSRDPAAAEEIAGVQPRLIEMSKPDYPDEARQNGWEGEVIVRVLVDTKGWVFRTEIVKSSGYKILDDEADSTAKTARFTPARQNGRPVAVWVPIPVKFSLDQHTFSPEVIHAGGGVTVTI